MVTAKKYAGLSCESNSATQRPTKAYCRDLNNIFKHALISSTQYNSPLDNNSAMKVRYLPSTKQKDKKVDVTLVTLGTAVLPMNTGTTPGTSMGTSEESAA
jgi:hypothetical protein